MYSIDFHLKILDILKILDDKKPDFWTVAQIYKEYETRENPPEKYKPILKRRIRKNLLILHQLKRVEKIETIEKKVFLYKFKIR